MCFAEVDDGELDAEPGLLGGFECLWDAIVVRSHAQEPRDEGDVGPMTSAGGGERPVQPHVCRGRL
jgi:hypothetical protein